VQEKRELKERRAILTNALANIFSSCDQSTKGYFNRDEYTGALDSHPLLLQRLNIAGINTKTDELVQVFDRLSQDAEYFGRVKIESLSEAITNLKGAATAADIYDLRYSLGAMRREITMHMAGMKTEMITRHETMTGKMATMKQIAEMQHEVSNIQREMEVLRQGLFTMNKNISEKLDTREESEDREQRDVLIKIKAKLDELANQFGARLIKEASKEDSCAKLEGVPHGDAEKNIDNTTTSHAVYESTLLAVQWAAELAEAQKTPNIEPESALCPELHAELERANLSLEPECGVREEPESTHHSRSEITMAVEPSPQNKTGQGQHQDSDFLIF